MNTPKTWKKLPSENYYARLYGEKDAQNAGTKTGRLICKLRFFATFCLVYPSLITFSHTNYFIYLDIIIMSENDTLPDDAQKAWHAYMEMKASKQEYFTFLQELDTKYKEGGTPGIAENLRLESLLKIHDTKVVTFNNAMQSIESKESRELLLKKLTEDTGNTGKH